MSKDQTPENKHSSLLEDAPTRHLDDGPTRRLEDVSDIARTLTADGSPPPALEGDLLGARVGKILILELLGVGGMGRVYAGWDEKLERRVALKSIRRRHGQGEDVKARFLQEAQILSKLQHPNICQIYDYIEGEDSDYLVLELIEGKTLVDLPRDSLTNADRLDLAIQLADVLAAAHAAGVVHRDLKPANVMITADLQAKMLDFGIARSIGDDEARRPRAAGPRSDSAFETQAGFVVGTPQYMSPEQARGESATPASDMYSFGLMLQELFTGRPCYDPKLSTLQLFGAVQEGLTEPITGLDPELTGLLERLKSPAQGARPSAIDTAERLRSIVDAPRRRRQQQLQIAAIVLLAFLAALMSFQAFRISQERSRAEAAAIEASREAETARQTFDVLLSLFEASDPWQADAWQTRGTELTVREVLDRGAERLETELPDRPIVRARLLSSLGEIHHRLGLFEESRHLLESALETHRSSGATPREIAKDLLGLAFLTQLEGDFKAAEQLLLEVQELQDSDPETPALERAQAFARLGRLYSERGPIDKALPHLEKALEIRQKELGEEDLSVAESLHHLGNFNDQQGHLGEAEKQLRRALEIREKLLDPGHPSIAKTLNALGIVLDRSSEIDEAEALYRRALDIMEARLDPDEPQLNVTQMNLGSALRKKGELTAADEFYQKALVGFEKRLGPTYPRVGEALGNLGVLRLDQGRFVESQEYFNRAQKIFADAFGERHPSVAMCLASAARADLTRRRFEQAEEGLIKAGEIFASTFGPEHPEVARTLQNRARALIGQDTPASLDAARNVMDKALEISDGSEGLDENSKATFQVTAAQIDRLRGDFEHAEVALEKAREIYGQATSTDQRQRRSQLLREVASLARDRGQLDEALENYRQSADLLQERFGDDHPSWILLLEEQAAALRSAGRTEEAMTLEARAGRLIKKYAVEKR